MKFTPEEYIVVKKTLDKLLTEQLITQEEYDNILKLAYIE